MGFDNLVPTEPTPIIEEWVAKKQDDRSWSIVNQYGMVIATQIQDEKTAYRIARLPELERLLAEG